MHAIKYLELDPQWNFGAKTLDVDCTKQTSPWN